MNTFRWFTPSRTAAVLFVCWCIAGAVLFRDYSISWDEPTERISGIRSEIILREHASRKRIPQQYFDVWQGDRFYGLIFQHVLLNAERMYSGGEINTKRYADRNVWYLRHFINFFAVTAGLAALYFSAKMVKSPGENRFYPVFTVLGFMLMPRFFAESFYNVKDMILLAGFMFAGYCMFSMMKKRTAASIMIFAFIAAFVSAIRLHGVVFFLIGLVRILTWLRPSFRRRLGLAALFTSLFVLFLVLFYPVSWENPFVFFIDAVKYMMAHPWHGHALFMGERLVSTGMPWYYIMVWMAVTIPLPLIVLGVAGTCFSLKSVIKKCRSFKRIIVLLRGGSDTDIQFQIKIIMVLMFWGGLLFFSFFSKVFYNGWRHYYFLAWPLLFLISDGFCGIWQKVQNNRFMARTTAAGSMLFAIYIVAWNVNAHPYQNCYFSILAGNPNGKFETDYWRLSNLEAFRNIVEYSKKNNRVSSVRLSLTCYSNLVMLPGTDAGYIKVLQPEDDFEFYVWYDGPVREQMRRRMIFEEKYCPDLFGNDVLLYTTLKMR